MTYIRKTVDEYDIEVHYPWSGWIVECTETTFKLAKECKKDYLNNQNYPVRIKKHRVKT